jgi:hypothetical protein
VAGTGTGTRSGCIRVATVDGNQRLRFSARTRQIINTTAGSKETTTHQVHTQPGAECPTPSGCTPTLNRSAPTTDTEAVCDPHEKHGKCELCTGRVPHRGQRVCTRVSKSSGRRRKRGRRRLSSAGAQRSRHGQAPGAALAVSESQAALQDSPVNECGLRLAAGIHAGRKKRSLQVLHEVWGVELLSTGTSSESQE